MRGEEDAPRQRSALTSAHFFHLFILILFILTFWTVCLMFLPSPVSLWGQGSSMALVLRGCLLSGTPRWAAPSWVPRRRRASVVKTQKGLLRLCWFSWTWRRVPVEEKASIRLCASEYRIFHTRFNWHILDFFPPTPPDAKTAVSSTTGVVLLLSDFKKNFFLWVWVVVSS